MWIEGLFLAICELSRKESEINKVDVLSAEIMLFVLIIALFSHNKNIKILFRLALEILILSVIFSLYPRIAYTLAVYLSLKNTSRLCVSDFHTIIAGAMFIFLVPLYILYFGHQCSHMHYVFFLGFVFDTFLPFDPLV